MRLSSRELLVLRALYDEKGVNKISALTGLKREEVARTLTSLINRGMVKRTKRGFKRMRKGYLAVLSSRFAPQQSKERRNSSDKILSYF